MIEIKLEGIQEAINSLKAFPGAALPALRGAIRRGLVAGKTAMTKAIRDRYNVPISWVRDAIGNPALSGLEGYLHVSGRKVPLFMFPHRDIFPEGIQFEEVKGHQSFFRHGFIPGHSRALSNKTKWYTRFGPGEPVEEFRIPRGLAVPQMLNPSTEPKVEERIEEVLYKSLEDSIAAILSGSVVMHNGRLRRADLLE